MSADLEVRQDLFMAALLTTGKVDAASSAAGISKQTGHSYIRDDQFQARLRAARRELVAGALGRMEQGLTRSVETLEEVQASQIAPASARVSAANSLLSHARGLRQEMDLEERLERLEALLTGPSDVRRAGVLPL